MRIYQSWKNYAAQLLLQWDLPVVTDWVRSWLVGLHADYFTKYSERDPATRRPLFEALFDATIDIYLTALSEGFPEAEAREITHIQGSWVFINQGWGELIEFPPDEATAYYERYAEFYDRHDCSPADPLGAFRPDGLPEAPETPERLNGDYPHAEAGLTDDVYVAAEKMDVRLRCGAEDPPDAEADFGSAPADD